MGFLLDLRYALRLLAKAPKFTVMTSFILMGGLAVSLLTFNFVYTIAFKPLDTPQGESIVGLKIHGDYPNGAILSKDLVDWDQGMIDDIYAEYAYSFREEVRLADGGMGRNLFGERVSANYFEFTRFEPLHGRSFTAQDEQSGGANVVAISYRTWQSMFGADESVIGRSVTLNNQAFEVVAVMPKGYQFPVGADLWLPIKKAYLSSPEAADVALSLVARMRDGISDDRANTDMAGFLSTRAYDALSESEKANFSSVRVEHLSLPELNMDGVGGIMFIGLQSIALAILLMAGINAGNMIFARSIERQKESAIRSALGATQKRLIRQLVIEGGLLTLLGGFFALFLTGWLLNVLDNIMQMALGANLPFWWQWQLDWQTITVALVFILFTFVFACLLPAVRAANMDINTVLRDGTRGALGRGAGRMSRILVTVQITLIAILMLTGSLGSSVIFKVIDVVESEQNEGRYRAMIELVGDKYDTQQEKAEFVKNLMLQMRSKSNIVEGGIFDNVGTQLVRIGDDEQRIDVISTTGNIAFFNLNILQGRDIDSRDDENNARVAMVSKSFVERYWPGQDVVGKMIDVNLEEKNLPHQIIGVVSNRGSNTQGAYAPVDQFDEVYISHLQYTYEYIPVIFEGTAEEAAKGEEDFYQVLYQLDATETLDHVVDLQRNANVMSEMLILTTKIIFYSGIFSLFLALMGVYGVAASAVAMRNHEIGIRRAIGARDSVIIRLFLKRNMVPLSVGLGIGLLIYVLSTFIFSQMLGGRIDMFTYIIIAVVTSALLTAMLLLSAYFPTRRAIEKEPSEVLRFE